MDSDAHPDLNQDWGILVIQVENDGAATPQMANAEATNKAGRGVVIFKFSSRVAITSAGHHFHQANSPIVVQLHRKKI